MNRTESRYRIALSCAIACWMAYMPGTAQAAPLEAATVFVRGDAAQEEAKLNPQQVTIITKEAIEEKQAKSVEDIIFNETGVSRTVDAMGRVGISIRGAEPRHTLILIDGQPVLGDFDKYSGAADEVMRIGTENVERIEIVQGAAGAKYGADAVGGVVNIITKKAAKTAGVQFNAEALRRKGDGGLAPFGNYFLRADSGELGKLRLGISGSKRDIMPVLASENRRASGFSYDYGSRDFAPNVLRYYGDASDITLTGTYTADKNNEFEFRLSRYNEDLIRDVKHSDSDLEPSQHFKRKADRNTGNLAWKGRAGDTDWKVEANYTRIKEDDVALISYTGRSAYEGKNELRYVDNIDHRQMDIGASGNTQINDAHLLSYGFGYSREEGKGSRLKSAPNTYTIYIDPWDYDKSLLVDRLDRLVRRPGDNSVRVYSHIHDYAFYDNGSNMPQWDIAYEYYGTIQGNAATVADITYDDYIYYELNKGMVNKSWWASTATAPNGLTMDAATYARYAAFKAKLEAENPNYPGSNIVGAYFEYGESNDPDMRANAPVFNGKAFLEEYRARDQRITIGEAEITKHNFFLSDTWQVNENTILVPILRYDHSSLFGSNLSASLGMTHNVGSNPHRRFKANVGTGYTEPGMGELYYNWEMYASNPVGIGYAKLGWYWAGNPDLKPEKSLNFDMSIEGENKSTYARLGVFHNKIKNYMSIYYTGELMDFAPYLGDSQKYQRAPDMIYSFKNIGRAEITGLQFEVRQKFGKHWSGRLGYSYLHAINKSDPNMPRQLLDKPVHKMDIGVGFEDKASGWNAQVWGNYYIRMLDSNTLINGGNYWPDIFENRGSAFEAQAYQRKTFGIWNFMLQKDLGDDAMAYFGINNVFNHRDDDRATQERVYRFGVNFKFGPSGRNDDDARNDGRQAGDAAELATDTIEAITAKGIADLTDAIHPDELNDFIVRPFDTTKTETVVDIIGDYRVRWGSHGGTNRPQSPYRANSSVGTAKDNMYDASRHGFEQRVRIGADARLGEHTNLKVLGSASGYGTQDEAHTVSENRGLSKQRLEELDLTQRVSKWDFSAGRLTETMGATGYWFGKTFDGARAVWTDSSSQLRIGYGSFKHSTGISDSAYNHTTYQVIYRPPTVNELIGINREDYPYSVANATRSGSDGVAVSADQPAAADSPTGIYESTYKGNTDALYFYQQLYETQDDPEAQKEIMARLHAIVAAAYPDEIAGKSFPLTVPTGAQILYEIESETGERYLRATSFTFSDYISSYTSAEEAAFINSVKDRFSIALSDGTAIPDGEAYLEANKESLLTVYNEIAERLAVKDWTENTWGELGELYTWIGDTHLKKSSWSSESNEGYRFVGIVDYLNFGWGTYDSTVGAYKVTRQDTLDSIYQGSFVSTAKSEVEYEMKLSNVLYGYLNGLENLLRSSESGNSLPREALGNVIGSVVKTEGIVLQQDSVPAIDKAVFVQFRKEIDKKLGFSAWYLRSVNDDERTYYHANGTGNDAHAFTNLANVLGIGMKYKLGRNATISFDYGRNHTKFGRYLNGYTVYSHVRGTGEFSVLGHEDGGTPYFWTARLDIGNVDTDIRGSWSAFIDYKYFEHGSFFGGNGTGAVPDRYLDGIRSFTFGGAYVPKKDLLLEAFYTFDAKGTSKRDTLYGAENFKLGNYTRVQATYKF